MVDLVPLHHRDSTILLLCPKPSSHFSDFRRAKVETKHSDVYRNHARAIGHPSLLWSLVSVKTTIVRIRHALVAFSEMGYTKSNHVVILDDRLVSFPYSEACPSM